MCASPALSDAAADAPRLPAPAEQFLALVRSPPDEWSPRAHAVLEQKIALMAGADVWHTARIDDPPVPAIRMSDGPAGVRGTSWTGPPSVSFPCGAALGATFDPALVAEIGGALARECIARGVNVLLGPTVNLARTPIGGRNFECFGEDPVLTAELGVAYIDGLQRRRRGRVRQALRRQRHRVRADDGLGRRSTRGRCASCTSSRSRRRCDGPACAA